MVIQIDARLEWKAARDPSSGEWIGVCEPLKLTALGMTWSELLAAIDDVIQSILSGMLEEGALPEYLRSHDWRAAGPIPSELPVGGVHFDLPFDLRHAQT